MTGFNGIGAYQQNSKLWNSNKTQKTGETESKKQVKESQAADKAAISSKASAVKTTDWKPIDLTSSLVPKKTDTYGMAIGEVQLSEKAQDYYSKLKEKFGNMEFILVSKDMKSSVQANAAAYGNSSKQVVLIDEEKLEMMANDESYRKKYEGIIQMSQTKLAELKNSLTSSGASVKNFGMSVNENGEESFFATLEKSTAEQTKRIEKKQAEKKAEKAKEKKHQEKVNEEKHKAKVKAEKAEREERLEKIKSEKDDQTSSIDGDELEAAEVKEYVKIDAGSMEDLIAKVSRYAYDAADAAVTEAERSVGQNIDFKG